MDTVEETLTLIIPVYNEEEVIEAVLEDWHSILTSLGINFKIKCYNDGSTDSSLHKLNKAKNLLGNVDVFDKPNSGHGPTILVGYKDSCNTSWIFQVDSDNEVRASEFTKLWRFRQSYDLILGNRVKVNVPFMRKVISRISQKVLSVLYNAQVKDVNSPFRLMRVQRFSSYFDLIPSDTFAPNLLITGIATKKKLRCLEVPVEYNPRQTGKVSIQKLKLLRVSFRAFLETTLFRFQP